MSRFHSGQNRYLYLFWMKFRMCHGRTIENLNKIAVDKLSDMFFKIKESLSRCGNLVQDVNSKKEINEILNSFYNPRMTKK